MIPTLQPARHEFLLPIPSRVRRALRRQSRQEGIVPAELARRVFRGDGGTARPVEAAPVPTVHTPPPAPAGQAISPGGRTVTARLTDRTFRRLEGAASKLGFTAGDLIRIGLQRVLKEVEAMDSPPVPRGA